MGGNFSLERKGKKEESQSFQDSAFKHYFSRFEERRGNLHELKDDEFDFNTSKDMKRIEKLENYGILPLGTLIEIFEYLNLNELLNCSCACKLFHSIIQTSIFWKIYYENVTGRKYPPNEDLLWKHEVFKLFLSFRGKNEYFQKLFYTSVSNWKEKKNPHFERFVDGKRKKVEIVPNRNYNSVVFDVLLKFLLVGDAGVGKTSLLLRKTEDIFTQNITSSIGVDFKIERAMFKNTQIKCQIWDTAGQERFRTITSNYYKGANGILICFSIDQKESFENLKHWITDVQAFRDIDVSMVIVGCKCDLENRRQVFKEDVVKLFKEFGLNYTTDYCECSSKDNMYIQLPFGMMMDKALSLYSKYSIENKK